MSGRKCSVCGGHSPHTRRSPSLGRFVLLCPDCEQEVEDAMRAPVDASLVCLDEVARVEGPSIFTYREDPGMRVWT